MSAPPPVAEISEATVIGQCLVYDYCIKEAAQILKIDDFYFDRNRILYKIMLDLNKDGITPDVRLVGQKLLDTGQDGKIGGLGALDGYINSVCTGQNLSYHAKIIKEKAALRNLITFSSEIKARAYDHPDPQGFLVESKASMIELAQVHAEKKVVESIDNDIRSVVKEVMSGKPPTGLIKTGINRLDRQCGGLHSNLLTVIAGRPGMGKSAFMLNIAINIGLRGGKVLYLTLEDAKQYQQRRMLARLARANLTNIMLNKPTAEESSRILETQVNLEKRKSPLFWIQDNAKTVDEILHSASTHQATIGLDVLMIDHLGYVKDKGVSEYEIVSNAVRGFAAMAKDLCIPVLLAVQFNRKITEKKREPQLSDLRGSGHIEEDARIVWFVDRPWLDDRDNADPFEFNLYISKSSHGKTGKVPLRCDMSQIYIHDGTDDGSVTHQDESAWQDTGYN